MSCPDRTWSRHYDVVTGDLHRSDGDDRTPFPVRPLCGHVRGHGPYQQIFDLTGVGIDDDLLEVYAVLERVRADGRYVRGQTQSLYRRIACAAARRRRLPR